MTERRVPALRWVARGALLLLLAFSNVHDLWSPDVVPNTLMAWTLIRERNLDFDEFTAPQRDPFPGARGPIIAVSPEIPRDSYFFRPCRPVGAEREYVPAGSPRSPGGPPPPGPDDHVCSVFPPGISLLALPVLVPFVLAGVQPSDGAALIRAGHLAAALIETIAALLLWSVVRRFTSDRWSVALVLLYWLGTSVRTVASQALWQHAGVHLFVALALWLMLHERTVSLRRELLAGLALGAGVAVRQTTLIAALAVAFAGHSRLGWPRVTADHSRLGWPRVTADQARASAVLFAGVVLGSIPLFVYGQLAFGSAAEQGYGDKPFDGSLATGLYGLLLSPSRGLFVYEPWILAGLAALVLAWRRSGPVALRLRGALVAWLVLLLYVYARYDEWWGGRVFGPRFLDDLAPVLVAALAWGIARGLLASTWSRAAFWIAAAWSLLLFNAAALVYDPNGWDTVPTNVNFDPSRLFSWSDPQWLSVLSSLGSADARVLAAALLSAVVVALLVRLELRAT